MASIPLLLTKFIVTSILIVGISELAKFMPRVGALVAALPTVTILVLIWLYIEGQSQQRISEHAIYTFWYVLPTLPMFLAFPYLIDRFSFWFALLLSALLTFACFLLLAVVVRRIGVELF